MSLLLRVGLVIGVIFYFSPVRKAGDPVSPARGSAGANRAPLHEAMLAEILTGSGSRPSAASLSGLTAEAERLWRSLPPDAQRAMLERIRAETASPTERPVSASAPGRPEEHRPPTRQGEPPRRP